MLTLRTSERSSLKACPQQWYWGQVEGLRANRDAAPLWFGSAVHEALAAWYLPGFARGPHPVETFEKMLEGDRSVLVSNEEEEGEYVDARALGVDMLTRYIDLYGTDPSWNVIATEEKFRLRVKMPERTAFGAVIPEHFIRYVMTWDGLYRDEEDGDLKLMEHKTAAAIWDDFLPMDDQAGSYWAMATPILRKRGLLGPKEEVAGIQYNFLRKAMADPRPQNARGEYTNKPQKQHYLDALEPFYQLTGKETVATLQELVDDVNKTMASPAVGDPLVVLGDVSANQPPAYFHREMVYRSRAERKTMIDRIRDEAFLAEGYRSGDLPIVKAPDKQRCGWCPFRVMCQLDESGDQLSVEEFKATQYTKSDPYAVYRKSA